MGSGRNLMQNAAIYTLSDILNAVIPFLLLPILTRVLLPAEYGVLAMFTATLGILSAFTGLSVHGAVSVRFVDRDNFDFPRYVGSCLFVLFVSSLFTLIVVCSLLGWISDYTGIPARWILLAVLVSLCNFLIQVRLGLWMMLKKPYKYGLFQFIFCLSNFGFSLFFVLLMKFGFEGRLLAQVLSAFIFSILAIVSMTISGWISYRPSLPFVVETLKFGIPLIPHVLGGFLIGFIDRFVIHSKLGLDAAGIYMVSVQLGMGLGLIANAFNKAYIPWLYEQLRSNSDILKKKVVVITWVYFFIAILLAIFVSMSAKVLVILVSGEEYVGASGALSWLAFGHAFSGMYFMVGNYLFFVKKTAVLAWITFASGGIGLCVTLVLVPKYGIDGAGISFAGAMLIKFLMTWYASHRAFPMPWLSSDIFITLRKFV